MMIVMIMGKMVMVKDTEDDDHGDAAHDGDNNNGDNDETYLVDFRLYRDFSALCIECWCKGSLRLHLFEFMKMQ